MISQPGPEYSKTAITHYIFLFFADNFVCNVLFEMIFYTSVSKPIQECIQIENIFT